MPIFYLGLQDLQQKYNFEVLKFKLFKEIKEIYYELPIHNIKFTKQSNI